MKLKIAICDDDNSQVEFTSYLINSIKADVNFEIMTVLSGEELLSMKGIKDLDIVFLDIEMNGINGIETAKEIRKLNKNAIIVFITGYKDYALEAYDLKAFHYLIKPISKDKMEKLMKDILRRKNEMDAYQEKEKELTIKIRDKLVKFKYDDIYYFEKYLKNIIVCSKEGDFKFIGTFKSLINQIDMRYFIQCNQGFIINKSKIFKLKEGLITIRDINKEIPVSRAYKEDIIKELENNLFQKN